MIELLGYKDRSIAETSSLYLLLMAIVLMLVKQIDYRRDNVKKTDTFIAKHPYIFYRIKKNDNILWKAENEQFFPKVVVTEQPDGQSFFRIYYNNEPPVSEIEYEPHSDAAQRNMHKSVPKSAHKSPPEELHSDALIPVITVDLANKRSNEFVTYDREDAKNREIFTTKRPYLIKKVTDQGQVLWESRDSMYAFRIIYRADPINPKMKVFFPEDQEQLPQQPAQHPPRKISEPLPKKRVETDTDSDIRIITRSDLESQTEGKTETEYIPRHGRHPKVQQHAIPQSGMETERRPKYHPEPRLLQAKPKPRVTTGPRTTGGRHFDYPYSAEPDQEPAAGRHRKTATEPTREPREAYEHYSEPEFRQATTDRQERRERRHEPRPAHRQDDRYDSGSEGRYESRPAARQQPGPAGVTRDQAGYSSEEIPIHRTRHQERLEDLPEPEFRPAAPPFVEPHVAAGKKIPMSVDIEFKFSTYLFDYQRHNNLGTYTPKEGFIIAKVRRNDKFYCKGSDVTIWQTHDSRIYSTMVNVLSDTRVVIHLNDGRTLFYKRGFDSQWFRIDKSTYDPIDWNHLLIDLDLASRRSTQYYEFFSYSNYVGRRKGTYLYVAREKFRFKSVYNNRTIIWAAYTEKECAYKVGVYRAIGGTEQVTIFLLNGETRTYIRQLYGLGVGSNWYEDIIMPGYGAPESHRSHLGHHRRGPPAPSGFMGIPTALQKLGQLKDKIVNQYNKVDFSKFYQYNPFSGIGQEESPQTQYYEGKQFNVKQSRPDPEYGSTRNLTFPFDDDDDDDEGMPEYVDYL
ncbi:hypothetical protein MACK_001488 [Theileria orientalis]|uniref:Uncharacterized protein n=1 Tax=Theileria orientalis TaxID=68886 RepID=A0A976MCJ7_THEOR|nr:hypothetical protein MACK_001488 [Theileria orientalis]